LLKITEVRAFPLSYPYVGPFVTLGTGTAIKLDVVIVRVRTEDGIVGYGEAHHALAPTVIADLVERHLGPLVVGEDALEVEHIWDKLYMSQGRTHSTGWGVWIAISGINTAIWDVRGKALGVPVYQLLGGKKKPIRAYMGGISLGYQAPESLADEAVAYVEQGYTALKLRLGDTPRKDIARVHAVRARVGDDVDLMTDINTKYTYQQMLQLLPALEACGAYWIEEPFPPDALRDYSLLAGRSRIPLAAGENHFLRYQARQFLETEAVQIVQSDVAKCGGISEHKKIADLAAAFRRSFAPHTSVSAISHAATLHVAMACSNTLIYEAAAPNAFKGEVVRPSPRVGTDGYVEPLDGPGLGVEVDESLFDKYPVIPGPCYV
jgi:L-alanine-DL-glutamate epimerase-like enolase superfamily enzyme